MAKFVFLYRGFHGVYFRQGKDDLCRFFKVKHIFSTLK